MRWRITKADSATIQKAQNNLLYRQLRYCKREVPFYRDQYETSPKDISAKQAVTSLKELPLLDKATVRTHQDRFIGERYRLAKLHKSFSSGSTGEPFASYFNSFAWWRKKYFVKLRARFACGMRLRQRVAILECEESSKVAERNRGYSLANLILPVKVFSLFQKTEDLLEQLRDYEPVNIYAYPSHLFELARESTEGQPLLPSVQRLFTSSEFLEQGTRKFIESRFAAPIFDHYGSTEFKEIAWQCTERHWYHVNYDELVCEVVDELGNELVDQPGYIAVSDLRNRAMPLIRFKLGDVGILTKQACACGFNGMSIKPLGGRASDYIELASGEQLSPFRFTTEIEYLDGLAHYQLLQHAPSEIEVLTVWLGAPLLEDVEAVIVEALGEHAEKVTVSARAVDSIENEPNSKFKVVKRLF